MRITPLLHLVVKASVLAIAILAAGCHSDGDRSPFLTESLGADAIAGSWLVQVPATHSCVPDLPAIDLRVTLDRTWVAGIDNEGDREYLLGTWRPAGDETGSDVLQGWIEPENRRLYLILWRGVHERGAVLRASVFGARILDGRLIEPVPPHPGGGFAQPVDGYPGIFAESSCSRELSGQRLQD